MPAEEVRYMRLLVFFDLPVKTKDDQREANRFRNFLLRDGYDRVQLSVYARVCRGPENVETHIRRLQKKPAAARLRAPAAGDGKTVRPHEIAGGGHAGHGKGGGHAIAAFLKSAAHTAPHTEKPCALTGENHCFLQ